jgi:predicted dehydrogenase
LRVAVIGCGSIGLRHIRNILALGHSVIATDVDESRLDAAVDAGARRGTLRDAEAVLICTPAHTHTSVLLELRHAGYTGPLFVEKPICNDLADRAEWETWPHPTTMVGYNLRFHTAARSLRDHVQQPTGGQFLLDCDARDWPGDRYASMLLECSHEIDLALFCGAPTTVIDKGNYVDEHDISFWLGPSWYVALRDRMPKYHRQWTLTRRGAEASAFFYEPAELGGQMYVGELAHFLDCAACGVATDTPFTDGLRVLDVIEQARKLAG